MDKFALAKLLVRTYNSNELKMLAFYVSEELGSSVGWGVSLDNDAFELCNKAHRRGVLDDLFERAMAGRPRWRAEFLALKGEPATLSADEQRVLNNTLCDLLIKSYPNKDGFKVLMSRAGVPASSIDTDGKMGDVWSQAMVDLDRADRLRLVISVVLADSSVSYYHKQIRDTWRKLNPDGAEHSAPVAAPVPVDVAVVQGQTYVVNAEAFDTLNDQFSSLMRIRVAINQRRSIFQLVGSFLRWVDNAKQGIPARLTRIEAQINANARANPLREDPFRKMKGSGLPNQKNAALFAEHLALTAAVLPFEAQTQTIPVGDLVSAGAQMNLGAVTPTTDRFTGEEVYEIPVSYVTTLDSVEEFLGVVVGLLEKGGFLDVLTAEGLGNDKLTRPRLAELHAHFKAALITTEKAATTLRASVDTTAPSEEDDTSWLD